MRAIRSNLQRASNSTRPFPGKPPAPVPILPRIRIRSIHTQSPLWTCNRCLGKKQHLPSSTNKLSARFPPSSSSRRFQSTLAEDAAFANGAVNIDKASKRRRRKLILGLVAGGATLGALRYGWQDLKHFVNAAERAGRVASGLVLCINE